MVMRQKAPPVSEMLKTLHGKPLVKAEQIARLLDANPDFKNVV